MSNKLISQDLLVDVLRHAQYEAVRMDAAENAILLDGLARIVGEMESIPQIDTLNRLRDMAYSDAVAHGLWEMQAAAYLNAARLILSEAHELYEAAFRLDPAYKMYPDYPDHDAIVYAWKHFCEEMADVIIMALSSCGELDINADAVVAQKMDVNHGRPWQHKEDKRYDRNGNPASARCGS